jgi:hypothetical protein
MNGPAVGSALLFLVAVAGAGVLQPHLAQAAHGVKEQADVYALPPPAELHAATLGWEAAAVDLLWSTLLVEYGSHWSEHRDFLDVPNYADAILELEPTYAPLYRYVDTMLAYRPLQGTEADVRKARAYLERGTRERPYDSALWMQYGQFLAFIAPSFLHDDSERDAWQRDGAIAVGHAVELGADAERALTAAAVLTRAGKNEVAVHYLERAYAFTEHPSMASAHEAIGRRLAALQANAIRDAADATAGAIDARRALEFPFLTREQYLLLGPRVDPVRCVGPGAFDDPACLRSLGQMGPQGPHALGDEVSPAP